MKQIRYGQWLETNDATKKRCSECDVTHLLAQYPHGNANYCPNCGAIMDKQAADANKVMNRIGDVMLGIFYAVIIGLMIFILINIANGNIKEKESKETVQYITDEDTGVQYIVHKDAITPRLDKDGKVVVAKKSHN